jgi:hypothetical protein
VILVELKKMTSNIKQAILSIFLILFYYYLTYFIKNYILNKMLKKIIFLTIFIFFHAIAFSQWQFANGPTGGTVQSIIKSGTNIFAGTARGVFYSRIMG